jgi:hypothetical protein
MEGQGHATPEAAVHGDIPDEYVTIVGVRIEGDDAHVWMVTNDRPTYEGHEVDCVKKGELWFAEGGSGGFSLLTPREVLATAARLCPGFKP